MKNKLLRVKLVFDRIRSADHLHFPALISLYELAFPVVERRELLALIEKFSDLRMNFSAIMLDSCLVGLVVYWQFDGFIYVEHLALFPDQRRHGIGSEVLKMLQNMGSPILLEVEIPYDDVSTNRVAFYHKSGFRSLPVAYFQPPYRSGESLLPMMLFSDFGKWEEEELKKSIQLFHRVVYQFETNMG
jgi:ribosomal protein S18 acetylase RimI-like enzyme